MTIFLKLREKPYLTFYILIISFLLIPMVSEVGRSAEKPKDTGLKVTLLIFSGRPNPVYYLEGEEKFLKFRDFDILDPIVA